MSPKVGQALHSSWGMVRFQQQEVSIAFVGVQAHSHAVLLILSRLTLGH
jgi:hypothetical protein